MTAGDRPTKFFDSEAPIAGFVEREVEQRLTFFASSLPQLIVRCSGDGALTWSSSQWTQFTDWSAAKSVGFGWLDAIHAADRTTMLDTWKLATVCSSYSVQKRVWCAARKEYRWHAVLASRAAGTDEWIVTMTEVHDLIEKCRRQDVVITELQHRARNLLSVVWAIASQTVRKTSSLVTFKKEFRKRIGALSRVQQLTWREDQGEIDLRSLLVTELQALSPESFEAGKIVISGPKIALSPNAAQALALAIHELATNAVKYGALSRAGARLELDWVVDVSSEPVLLRLSWQEKGVPISLETPRRSGYGSELIERALPFDLGARTELRFGSDGVSCKIELPYQRPGDSI